MQAIRPALLKNKGVAVVPFYFCHNNSTKVYSRPMTSTNRPHDGGVPEGEGRGALWQAARVNLAEIVFCDLPQELQFLRSVCQRRDGE